MSTRKATERGMNSVLCVIFCYHQPSWCLGQNTLQPDNVPIPLPYIPNVFKNPKQWDLQAMPQTYSHLAHHRVFQTNTGEQMCTQQKS